MKPQSIAIFSGSHLCHNPRVIKEATTLADAGYKVEVIGGWFDKTLRGRDQELLRGLNFAYAPVLDLVANGGSTRFTARLKRKVGEMAYLKAGVENSWQLGYFSSALREAVARSRADLLIAHSEPTMAAMGGTEQAPGRRLGIDMEDWFSEEGTNETRKTRPNRLLRSLEQSFLKEASHSSCPSRAMSEALASEFECKPPVVIYNAFEWSERMKLDRQVKDRKNLRSASIHWYSQTLGYARGLEDLLAALPHLNHEVEVHLRGKPVIGFEAWLTRLVPPSFRSRIHIHGLVTNDELLSRIAEHDIGFAGEARYCRNKELTISNKLLQYLLAGLAVVASDTAGHQEVARQAPGAVAIYKSGDPLALANEINALLAAPEKLRATRAAALMAAEKTFCWERQAPILLESIERALAS